MEIIKKGTIKKKEWIKICPKCHTKFKYNEDDVKSDRDGDYVACPICNEYLFHF